MDPYYGITAEIGGVGFLYGSQSLDFEDEKSTATGTVKLTTPSSVFAETGMFNKPYDFELINYRNGGPYLTGVRSELEYSYLITAPSKIAADLFEIAYPNVSASGFYEIKIGENDTLFNFAQSIASVQFSDNGSAFVYDLIESYEFQDGYIYQKTGTFNELLSYSRLNETQFSGRIYLQAQVQVSYLFDQDMLDLIASDPDVLSLVTWPTYASAFIDPIISIDPEFLTANPGFSITQIVLANDSAVPEPSSWALLIAGFGLVGATMRKRRTTGITA
jgi:hypothetical protein